MVLKVTTNRVEYKHNGGVRVYNSGQQPGKYTLAGNPIKAALVASRNGSIVPGYRALIQKGQCATSPFTGEFQNVLYAKQAGIHVTWRERQGYGTSTTESYFETCGGPDGVPTNLTHLTLAASSADNKALIRARSAVKSRQQHMSGFTFLGELKESIQGIRRPARAILRGASQYLSALSKRKRGLRGTARQKSKALADAAAGTWLEVSFGWKPLIKDVKDIAETLARYHSAEQRHDYVRGYGKDEVTQLVNEYDVPVVAGISAKGRTVRTTSRTVVYRCHMRATDTPPPLDSIDRLRQLAGFRTEDFVPSVWQLLPWSFLVDYFVNIGDVLEAACTSVASVDWVNRSEVVETVQETFLQLYPKYDPSQWWYELLSTRVLGDMTLARSKSSLKSVTRSKQDSIGLPSLEFSFPEGDSLKWVNMLALLGAQHDKVLRF